MRTSCAAFLTCVLLAACADPGLAPWQARWQAQVGAGLTLHPVSGPELRQLIRVADAELVVVNVWATWCIPCREEFPALLRLRRIYGPRGVALVLLSGDFPSERDSALDFLESAGVDFATFLKSGKDMDLINALEPKWSGALPATFVFADGELVDWWEGPASYQTFAAAVENALASRPVEGNRR